MKFQKGVSEVVGFMFVSGILLFYMAGAEVHYYDFVLKETNFTRLCITKSILTVNGSFPGPVIRVHRGDTVYVNVHNEGYYGFTLHWHGVKQPRNPWSDGPEYITQCPIQPGTNFTYEVIFSKEEGTLWWHAHSDWTRSTINGAIVVLPAQGTTFPYPEPDGEEILIIGDWYTEDVNQMLDYYLKRGLDPVKSNATVLNGEPGDFYECSNETTYRWQVDYGKTYLLRLINAGMNSEYFFAIAEHNVTVVGMDGNYLKPFSTPNVMISSGQTIDVLLTTDQSLGHYYMAASQHLTDGTADGNNATAILEYRGDYTPTKSPIFPSNLPYYVDYTDADIFFSRLRSLASPEHPVDVPLNISTNMFVTVALNELLCPNSSCEGPQGNKVASSLSNITFQVPSIDVLQAYYRDISGIYTPDFPDFPPSFYNFTGDNLPNSTKFSMIATKAKMLDYNETVEIVFQDTNVFNGSENHPMHLHGYSFYVVGSGSGNYNNWTDPQGYNLVDPPEMNSIGVPRKGWVAVRFTANNPGVWYWHCHYARHETWGMDTVFIVKNGDTPETSIRDPPANMPRCEDSSITLFNELNDSFGPLQENREMVADIWQ